MGDGRQSDGEGGLPLNPKAAATQVSHEAQDLFREQFLATRRQFRSVVQDLQTQALGAAGITREGSTYTADLGDGASASLGPRSQSITWDSFNLYRNGRTAGFNYGNDISVSTSPTSTTARFGEVLSLERTAGDTHIQITDPFATGSTFNLDHRPTGDWVELRSAYLGANFSAHRSSDGSTFTVSDLSGNVATLTSQNHQIFGSVVSPELGGSLSVREGPGVFELRATGSDEVLRIRTTSAGRLVIDRPQFPGLPGLPELRNIAGLPEIPALPPLASLTTMPFRPRLEMASVLPHITLPQMQLDTEVGNLPGTFTVGLDPITTTARWRAGGDNWNVSITGSQDHFMEGVPLGPRVVQDIVGSMGNGRLTFGANYGNFEGALTAGTGQPLQVDVGARVCENSFVFAHYGGREIAVGGQVSNVEFSFLDNLRTGDAHLGIGGNVLGNRFGLGISHRPHGRFSYDLNLGLSIPLYPWR
jgi:hypothetical protein